MKNTLLLLGAMICFITALYLAYNSKEYYVIMAVLGIYCACSIDEDNNNTMQGERMQKSF